MKLKLTALAITALVVAAFASTPANAQGNARFKFAPNTYRLEEGRKPQPTGPVHSVRSGSVPTGTSFLGLSPNMLQPAPKPVVQQQPQPQMQVAATPSWTQATPQLAVPKAGFNANFGKPIGHAAPQVPLVASAPVAQPPLPQVATAKSLQMPKVVHKAAPKRPAVQVSRSVSGKLRKPAAPVGAVAQAKGIDSYGKNFGYVPGAYLPSVGSTTQTDVYGQLVKNR